MAIATIPQRAMSEQGFSFRNLIINGDMSIAQRGTSATGLTNGSNGYHTVDRWQFNESGSPTFQFTMSQSTTVPTGQGFGYSTKFDCTTAQGSLAAGDFLAFRTALEGQMLQSIKKGTSNAESLSLSFWVRSNKTGTYGIFLNETDNNRQNTQTYTIDSADTWEKKTITFVPDTTGTINNDNGSSLYLHFILGCGTDFTSGTFTENSWEATTQANRCSSSQVNLADNTANEWFVTGVQLEVGTSASDFEFLPYDVNFERCARYYYEWGGLDAYETAFVGTWTSSSACYMKLEHYKEMRGTPSFSKTGNWAILGPGGTLGTTANTGHVTRRAIQIEWAGGSGGTQGRAGLVRAANDSSARLKVDAEL